MRAEDLFELLRKRPFEPFRLYATDGPTYDVRHPDQALVLKSRVILPMPAGAGVPEGSEHLALSHIVRAEVIPQTSASAAN
jgi:hypothetical protein